MMNIDRPKGTRFTLDDGRVVILHELQWDGRVRLEVERWPVGWYSKSRSANRQPVIYMTPRAFARRARYDDRNDRQEGGESQPGDNMHH